MVIQKYSLKTKGKTYKLSDHFSLGEMACRDGTDTVLVSMELIRMLEALREYVGGTITITSGYRTAAYNKKIGGATQSQHAKGTAADVIVRDHNGAVIDGRLVCCLCQTLGFRGVGWISFSAVHLDMRAAGLYRGNEYKGYGNNVNGDFYRYFGFNASRIWALKYRPETNTITPKKEDKMEDEEMIYKTIAEVPEWGQASVQLRIDHGWTDGKNLTDSMIRGWVVQDREDPYVAAIDNAPLWARTEIEKLISKGKIKGNGVEQIGMRMSTLKAIIVADRG